MSRTDMEHSLRELFRHQERGIQPSEVEWGETLLRRAHDRNRPRGRVVAAVSVAAAFALVVGLVVAFNDQPGQRVTTPASTGAHRNPVTWQTAQVSVAAEDLRFDVGGVVFAADDPQIDVHSDAGDDHYQTFELVWHEHGTEMRWNIYFASDGTDWWATEMRTYDGAIRGDWITFRGQFFRARLGQGFVGHLDVTAQDHGITSHITADNLRLQAFRR